MSDLVARALAARAARRRAEEMVSEFPEPAPGRDGVGIASVQIKDNDLVLTMTDGRTIRGRVRGESGKDGKDGKDGEDGVGIDRIYEERGKLVIVLKDGRKFRFNLPSGGVLRLVSRDTTASVPDNVVTGEGISSIVALTQAEYDALEAPDPATFYVVTDAESPSLATVATTGSYDDLADKPVLGTAAATDASDYATAAQGALAESALQSVPAPTIPAPTDLTDQMPGVLAEIDDG